MGSSTWVQLQIPPQDNLQILEIQKLVRKGKLPDGPLLPTSSTCMFKNWMYNFDQIWKHLKFSNWEKKMWNINIACITIAVQLKTTFLYTTKIKWYYTCIHRHNLFLFLCPQATKVTKGWAGCLIPFPKLYQHAILKQRNFILFIWPKFITFYGTQQLAC